MKKALEVLFSCRFFSQRERSEWCFWILLQRRGRKNGTPTSTYLVGSRGGWGEIPGKKKRNNHIILAAACMTLEAARNSSLSKLFHLDTILGQAAISERHISTPPTPSGFMWTLCGLYGEKCCLQYFSRVCWQHFLFVM